MTHDLLCSGRPLGRISQMQPQGGTTVTYVYDALDRLTQIQRGTDTFTYAYSGVNPLVQTLTRPNGSVTAYQYNALNQVTKILNRTSTGTVLSQHTYTYNTQDLRDAEMFDGSAIPPAPAVPDSATTYTVNAVNQLLSTTTPNRTFVYDLDGNLTQGSTKDGYQFTAAYDAENRLTSIQYTGSGGIVHRQEFRYRGDDLLAEQKRYENGALMETVRIVHDGMLAIQDRNASNAVTREYTWGLNLGGGIEGLLNLKTAGQNYAYLYDGKGNIEAVLNAAQQVVAAYRYDPFGVLLAKTGSFEQPFGFSTKRYNAPVGMVQYEARNYFPPIGRWDRRDPLGEAGGLNLYAFVGNNPVNWVDPWGLDYIEFLINNKTGKVFYRKNNGDIVFAVPANSGKGLGLNNPAMQTEKWTGPIRSGNYTINLSNNAEPDKTILNGPGWGLFGWELNESFSTKLGRKLFTDRDGGFYLHQDEYQGNPPGTGGCIGVVGDDNIKKIKTALENYATQGNGSIPVIVNYPR